MTQVETNIAPIVFVVDDDVNVREGLKALLESVGLQAEVFASAREFLQRPASETVSCLVLDVRMPGMSGLELQDRLHAANSPIPIIFISAHDDGDAKARALRAGAIGYLQKPFSEDALLGAIGACLGRS